MNILELMNYVDSITEESSSVAISAIAALRKSDQTYAHCIDVGAIFQTAYGRILARRKWTSVFKDDNEVLLGAFMHDFGKANLPKDILDSDAVFDPDGPEMREMRKHPEFGARILEKIRMPSYIVNMALHHHVKIDQSLQKSYPNVEHNDRLSREDRLLAIIDTYQALIGRRAYKKSWAPPSAIRYMEQLAGVELEAELWYDFVAVMGRYSVGSLVQLSDGSRAFVTAVPESDPERPQVVVVLNKEGVRLTHNDYIDLAVSRELSIKKGLDHDEVFGDASLDVFLSLKIG
jgi:putative nucleotidyltransferase with HDIG domain